MESIKASTKHLNEIEHTIKREGNEKEYGLNLLDYQTRLKNLRKYFPQPHS